ncbi:MAG: ArsA family ATPase [Deltaproteobacteria bacterium]|nr:ArsA family ATPase [Deltaproteobacteria bacterium]
MVPELTMLEPSDLFSRKLLLVTGKGGIGKTLLTAALGQLAASQGKRVLLVEYVACDQLAPLFGGQLPGHTERTVAPRIDCVNIDPTENFREYVTKYLKQKRLYDTIFSHRVVKSFINTVPGLAELMLLGRLFYHCELQEARPYDLVILDAFASGHFLSLMTTPDAIRDTSIGGPLNKETERVRNFLQDASKCATVFVTIPEPLVVSETLDFLPLLREKSPSKVAALVVNRMPPDIMGLPMEGPATAYLRRAHTVAQEALATLKSGIADTKLPLWTLPELGFVPTPLPGDFAARFFSRHGGEP